jgi:hypothetical protein
MGAKNKLKSEYFFVVLGRVDKSENLTLQNEQKNFI